MSERKFTPEPAFGRLLDDLRQGESVTMLRAAIKGHEGADQQEKNPYIAEDMRAYQVKRKAYLVETEARAAALDGILAAAHDLFEAAREGLICAEADVEARRESNLEHGDDDAADPTLAVFIKRRDQIASALARARGDQP